MAKKNGNSNIGHIKLEYEKGDVKPVFGIFKVETKKFSEAYFSMFQDSLITIAKLKLPGTTCWVFNYLCGKMDFDNAIHIPQKKIAMDLNIAQANVSKAINELVFFGVLIPGETMGTAKTYKLNCHLCWKGRVKNLDKERLKSV